MVSFQAEEWAGVGLKSGGMCYVFNDVVLCSKKRPASLFSKGRGKLDVMVELPASSCQHVAPARTHGVAPPPLQC